MSEVMQKFAERYAERYLEQAKYQQQLEFAENLLKEDMSVDFIVRTTELPLEIVRELAKKRSA